MSNLNILVNSNIGQLNAVELAMKEVCEPDFEQDVSNAKQMIRRIKTLQEELSEAESVFADKKYKIETEITVLATSLNEISSKSNIVS